MSLADARTPIPEQDIRDALACIFASAAFRSAPRLRAFLRYIVERVLAGDAERIKGYCIAVEALDRTADFDPVADPIVRVEAGRLRAALARYYETDGAQVPLTIEVPLGNYVPRFRLRERASSPTPRTPHVNALHALFEQLIGERRTQLRQIEAEIAAVEQALAHTNRILHAALEGPPACRVAPRLIPTAPSGEGTSAANGPETQQAESAPAARTRRPRPRRDRGHAPHDREDPAGLRAVRI